MPRARAIHRAGARSSSVSPALRGRGGAVRAANLDAASRRVRIGVRYRPGGGELALLMEFYRLGREEGGDFEVGIQYALSRMLVDPNFLYRFESEPADVAVGDVYRIGDLELASRLSFFLWSSIPDEELLELAVGGASARSHGARCAGRADARGRTLRRARREFRGPVARPSRARRAAVAGSGARCGSARRVSARDGALVRRRAARAPQRARRCSTRTTPI